MQDPGKNPGLTGNDSLHIPTKLEVESWQLGPGSASLAVSDCVWSLALGEARARGLGATVWHMACGQRACEGAGMRDNIGSRQK